MHKLMCIVGAVLFLLVTISCEFDDGGTDSAIEEDRKESELPGPEEFVPLEIYPEMLGCDSLEYPKWHAEWGTRAVVWVKVLVGKHGDVLGVLIGKTSGIHELDNAAIENAATCEFKPGIQNGRPVAVWVTFQILFTPGQ